VSLAAGWRVRANTERRPAPRRRGPGELWRPGAAAPELLLSQPSHRLAIPYRKYASSLDSRWTLTCTNGPQWI